MPCIKVEVLTACLLGSKINRAKVVLLTWELWAHQDFSFRGRKYIINKVRIVSLACDMPTGPYLCLYQIVLRYFKPLRSNKSAQEFGLEIHSGDITRKKRKSKSCLSCM